MEFPEVAENCIYSPARRGQFSVRSLPFSLMFLGSYGGPKLLSLLIPLPDYFWASLQLGMFLVVIQVSHKKWLAWMQEVDEDLRPQLEDRYVRSFEKSIHVGIAPGRKERSYSGDTSWDIGFIEASDSLLFYGDQSRFQLLASDMVQVELRAPITKAPRLLIQFAYPNGNTAWIAIEIREGQSRTSQLAAMHRLKAQITLMGGTQRKNGFLLPRGL